MNSFYITTPIYYVNDKPHIGHAYTTILGDVISEYHRRFGDNTWFLTGTDEHGQKVEKAAIQNNLQPIQQCDETVKRYKELWTRLGIKNDDFIRTTEDRHVKVVQAILQDLFDRDLIYKDSYKGRYCVPCERFFTEKDLAEDNLCPDCHRPTNELVEENYFFRMSRYQEWLIDYIKTHPGFIQPAFRANETLGFLKKPLADLCISRPKERLSWGIELPFDKNYVCYVWFDALINYISAIGFGSDPDRFARWWPVCHHLIGKDILTTHTVYWPTMLKAIGIEPPKTILAHGWWLSGKDKMSKSLGNVINPMDMADKYGVDAFRYFLLSEMSLGQDAAFSEEAFVTRYNSDLANDLGNMLSRVVKLTLRSFNGILPEPGEPGELEKELSAKALAAVDEVEKLVRDLKLDKAVETILNVVRAANKYFDATAPWVLAKENRLPELAKVLYTAAETLRIVGGLLYPVFPGKAGKLLETIGVGTEFTFADLRTFGVLKPGTVLKDIPGLFPRIMAEKKDAASGKCACAEKKAPKKPEKQEEAPVGIITIDEFAKVSLKTARVLEAVPVEGSSKLLKLQIDLGSEKRQIVSGIAKWYKPEEMIGKTIIVVANLKPAEIFKTPSNGMLLAAKSGDTLELVTVGGNIPAGTPIG